MRNHTYPHYWFGEWINDEQLAQALIPDNLSPRLNETLSQIFPFQDLLQACQSLVDDLSKQQSSFKALQPHLEANMTLVEAQSVLAQLVEMLQKSSLQDKLLSELGCIQPNVWYDSCHHAFCFYVFIFKVHCFNSSCDFGGYFDCGGVEYE